MSTLTQVAVLIYCQNPIAVLGFGRLFDENPLYRSMVSTTTRQVLELIGTLRPDLALLDLDDEVDLSLVQKIRSWSPETKIILWAGSVCPEMAAHAIKLGVAGILSRNSDPNQFLEDLQAVQQGQIVIERELNERIAAERHVKLSRREFELLALIAQGFCNKEIATRLSITENTVKSYLSRLFDKLDVDDRHALAVYGLTNLSMDLAALRTKLGRRNALLPEMTGNSMHFAAQTTSR
jgi:DNA-binding NarL/FixJ family response regulator